MFKPNDMIAIINRSSGTVSYRIPEERIRRDFNMKERKIVPFSEIMAVAAQEGGSNLLYNYFLFEDKNVLRQVLNREPEIEDQLTEQNIPSWMERCSLEEFQDALDFAPDGIKDLIKHFAVQLPLNDMRKRKALQDQLGFNCTRAIENEQAVKEDDEKTSTSNGARRRVVAEERQVETPTRRATKKYNVIKGN